MKDLLRRTSAKVNRSLAEHSFNRVGRGILKTPALCMDGNSPLFVSMVRRRDVIPYLIAIKSLYTRIGHGRVIVINEQSVRNEHSLTSDDVALLQHHVPGIMVADLDTISTGSCPRGGTWERLVRIVELSSENYVIQADADTLVSASIPEVIQCWKENRSFLMDGGAHQQVSPAPVTARMAREWIKTYGWDHVGMDAEASLDKMPRSEERMYVHASSGFAGFARGMFSLMDLESFSQEMSKLLGWERWQQLGSEQIGSNYILANAPGAIVLPSRKYACFSPDEDHSEAAVLHFIGEVRHIGGTYKRRAGEFIAEYKKIESSQEAPVMNGQDIDRVNRSTA